MKKKVVWGRLQSLTEGVPSVPLSEDETVIGRKDVGGGNMNISSRHFKVIRSRAEGKEEEKEEKEKGGKDKDKGGGEETKGKEASSTATKYTLVDTSTNGTYVNKERATKNVSTVIQDGYDVSMLDPVKCSDLAIKYIFTVLAEEEEEKQQHGPQDTYTFGEVLGTGHFAVVRKVCDHAGCYYAMKVIEKAKISSPAAGKEKEGAEGMEAAAAVSKRTKKIMDEAAILRKVSHPNIVTIKDVFETKRKVYIIMELMEGGDLLDRVTGNPLTEDDARTVMRGILSGLKYLHANNIVHRDLKPENIMMAGKGSLDVKITDFGLSRVVDEKGLMSTLCGTPQYMAPEILMKQKYSSKADIWSIGIILYVILSSRLPFSGSTINAIFKRIHAGHLDFSSPPWLRVSALAKEVIRFILVTNPEKRPSVDEVLAHKWFSVDSKKVDVKKEGDGSGNADDDKESSTAEEAEKDIQQQQQQPPAKRKHVECKSAAF